jgi:mono/diheme cytochrome c family protein
MRILRFVLAAALLHGATAFAQATAVSDGQRAYMVAGCYQCHGNAGQGGVGPRLAPKPFPVEGLIAFVRNSSRNMPAYAPQVLSDADLRTIHAYLSSVEASPTADQIPLLK